MRRVQFISTRCVAVALTVLPTPSHPVRSTQNGTMNVAIRFAGNLCAPAVNFYKRLGVDSTATSEDLKTAYRHRALVCHPDVVDENKKAEAEVEFRAVSEAYDVLMDPEKRAEHDKSLGLNVVAPPKKKEKTDASSSSSLSSARSTMAMRYQKTFVRGDADRKFREAFHGKSLDQIIFQERLRRRLMQQEQHSETISKSSPTAYEESLRQVMTDAAERFASKVQRQYGPGILRHVKMHTFHGSSPKTPPSAHMPFRPFRGWSVPEGVSTPPEPSLGCTSHVNEEEGPVELADSGAPKRRDLPKHFPIVKTMDGSNIMRHNEAAVYIEKERHAPYNMGKLYSYHRPY